MNSSLYYPFQRLKNLYEWYICRGFCFWQTDLAGAPGVPIVSGAAERIFGFGQIKPPGDFDGDGLWFPLAQGNPDWVAYMAQYTKWGPGGYFRLAMDRPARRTTTATWTVTVGHR